MNFDTLNELIEMPKKAEASKAKKKTYLEQMQQLLSEEGFSSSAVKYLKSGFTFSGAKPIAVYLQKIPTDQRQTEIEKLLASDLFRGGDKLVAFRFGISLSAYSVEWFGEDQRILINMIKVLPTASKNKEKQLLKDAPKIFEKYFLDVVSDSTTLPLVDITGLKDIYIREYRQMMEEILNRVSDNYRGRASRIGSWIGGITVVNATPAPLGVVETKTEEGKTPDEDIADKSVSDDASKTTSDIPSVAFALSSENTATKMSERDEKRVVPFTEMELYEAMTLLGDFSARLEATIPSWTSAKKELDAARSEIRELSRKLQQSEYQFENEKKRNEQITIELDYRSKIIADLHAQLLNAKETVAGLQKQLEETSAENVRLNSIISVYSSDKQNSQSEQLNSIASKLKSEYRDYKAAENDEMTIDLGENFRFQLQSIFRILAKAGIDVERR